MNGNAVVIHKLTEQDIPATKQLIQQYIAWINEDLSFQNIVQELAEFPAIYREPRGAFFTAKVDDYVVGCVGLKPFAGDIAEMKRLFVADAYKGQGIGAALITRVLSEAKDKGYQRIRLDTLRKMQSAKALYATFGFYAISPYVENPLQGVVYMEKLLSDSGM